MNDMMIPKLHKIVLNMGVGEASHNSKIADAIYRDRVVDAYEQGYD